MKIIHFASALVLMSTTFFSCSKKDSNPAVTPTIESIDPNVLKAQQSMNSFAKVLSNAMAQDASIRTFIKQKALEQVDNDYDVFYNFVKDETVSEGKTFREKLLKYAGSEDSLSVIENNLPLLTIYVPELPSGFNAGTWDASAEEPAIFSVMSGNEDKLPFYKNGVVDVTLAPNEIPGFPTLVIKNNERIRQDIGTNTTAAGGQRLMNINAKGGTAAVPNKMGYSFIDPCFDNMSGNSSKQKSLMASVNNQRITGSANTILATNQNSPLNDNLLVNAYNIMGADGYNWQRDNIYYNLTQTQTNGGLNRSVAEYIYRIKFETAAIAKLTEHPNAPKRIIKDLYNPSSVSPLIPPSQTAYWTEGRFEIKIDILINDKNGLGPTITKYFSVLPTDLYEVAFQRAGGRSVRYFVTGVTSKYYYPSNLDLITWDLENKGFSWKFNISEENETATVTRTETYTTEFAANFQVDLKIGLKFGASAKTTSTNTYTIQTSSGTKELGSIELSFSDPVLVPGSDPESPGSSLRIYEKNNPYVIMAVVPKKYY